MASEMRVSVEGFKLPEGGSFGGTPDLSATLPIDAPATEARSA